MQLCEIFHCLPSELEKQDHELMMKLYALKVAEHEFSSWEREYEKEHKGVSPYVKLGLEIAKLEKELGAV